MCTELMLELKLYCHMFFTEAHVLSCDSFFTHLVQSCRFCTRNASCQASHKHRVTLVYVHIQSSFIVIGTKHYFQNDIHFNKLLALYCSSLWTLTIIYITSEVTAALSTTSAARTHRVALSLNRPLFHRISNMFYISNLGHLV